MDLTNYHRLRVRDAVTNHDHTGYVKHAFEYAAHTKEVATILPLDGPIPEELHDIILRDESHAWRVPYAKQGDDLALLAKLVKQEKRAPVLNAAAAREDLTPEMVQDLLAKGKGRCLLNLACNMTLDDEVRFTAVKRAIKKFKVEPHLYEDEDNLYLRGQKHLHEIVLSTIGVARPHVTGDVWQIAAELGVDFTLDEVEALWQYADAVYLGNLSITQDVLDFLNEKVRRHKDKLTLPLDTASLKTIRDKYDSVQCWVNLLGSGHETISGIMRSRNPLVILNLVAKGYTRQPELMVEPLEYNPALVNIVDDPDACVQLVSYHTPEFAESASHDVYGSLPAQYCYRFGEQRTIGYVNSRISEDNETAWKSFFSSLERWDGSLDDLIEVSLALAA